MKRRTQLPLDKLSAVVMISNVQPYDLIDAYGPFGSKYQLVVRKNKAGVVEAHTLRRNLPSSAGRLYCLTHMLLVLRRLTPSGWRDTELDFFQELMTTAALESAVRDGHIRLFGVRRPSTKTWGQCPHCRWKERKLERLRQPYL